MSTAKNVHKSTCEIVVQIYGKLYTALQVHLPLLFDIFYRRFQMLFNVYTYSLRSILHSKKRLASLFVKGRENGLFGFWGEVRQSFAWNKMKTKLLSKRPFYKNRLSKEVKSHIIVALLALFFFLLLLSSRSATSIGGSTSSTSGRSGRSRRGTNVKTKFLNVAVGQIRSVQAWWWKNG